MQGGAGVVVKNAGKDATAVYKPIHPPNAISENLRSDQFIGTLDPDTIPKEDRGPSEAELMQERRSKLPHVQSMISLDDFERTAEHVLGEARPLPIIDQPQTTSWPFAEIERLSLT
jgi:L-lactate dehydrogenase (cytochrome)